MNLTGKNVACVVNGTEVFRGVCEYQQGEWFGIRQADGRLDECHASHLWLV